MPNALNELVHRYVTLATSDYTISWFIIGMGDLVRVNMRVWYPVTDPH